MYWPIILKMLLAIILIVATYCFFISAAVNNLRKTYKLRRHGIKVEGKIFDNEKSRNTDGGNEYYPLVEYCVNVRLYQKRMFYPKSEPGQIGDKVEVLCDSENPEYAIINKPSVLPNIYFVIFFWVVLIMGLVAAFIFGSPLPNSSYVFP